MFKYLKDLVSTTPIELILGLLASGLLVGPDPSTPTERFLILILIIGVMAGLVRAILFFGLDSEALDAGFVDSQAPDFESETGPVDPWFLMGDQMLATGWRPPEDAPIVGAETLRYMTKIIDHLGALVNSINGALPTTSPLMNDQMHRNFTEVKRALTQLEADLYRTREVMAPAVNRLMVTMSLEDPPQYAPMWKGLDLSASKATVLLMDLTEVMKDLALIGITTGLPVDDAFEAMVKKQDQVRNAYGLFEVDPIYGSWPIAPTTDYSKLVDREFPDLTNRVGY